MAVRVPVDRRPELLRNPRPAEMSGRRLQKFDISVNRKEKTVAEGQVTVGSFELHNCIASGNSTQIWEVAEQGTPMRLAMKLLLEQSHKEKAEKDLLKHEFKVGSALEHPGFLRFHQIEVNRDHGFFTMDFVRSPSLKQQITGSLPVIQSSFRKMAESLCRAYQFMHEQGWIHSDIKPDNILVNKTGEIKIIDFSLTSRVKSGIGKLLGGKQPIRGTRNYLAPETILKKPADQKTDLYSLGVTLYEVLTGSLPFAGSTPSQLLMKHVGKQPAPPSVTNPNVTHELDDVILKMLAKKPADRFESMQEAGVAIRGMKCFVKDPVELHESMMREEKEQSNLSLDKRLDSRADAERTAQGITTPFVPKKKRPSAAAVLAEQEQARQAAMQPAAPGMPPMQYPGMPGYQMPGLMPGQSYPGQPLPMVGQQMPYPVQPMPGQPWPGQLYAGQPVPALPVAGQPAAQDGVLPDGSSSGPTGSAAPPTSAPVNHQNSAPGTSQPVQDEPKEATEDDVRGLMDMIE